MRVLITGSLGFVGRNLMTSLVRRPDLDIQGYDMGDSLDILRDRVLWAEAIIHLAGVNRPVHVDEFQTGNTDLTQHVMDMLASEGRSTPILLASSTQAVLDNPYGHSKRLAEGAVFGYRERCHAPVYVFRLPNVFGKWCRPNYNSAVATFCHAITRDLPITINDPSSPLTLVYIDDVIDAFAEALDGRVVREGAHCVVPISYETTVGEVADLLKRFRTGREDLSLPLLSDGFQKKLFATYMSYLPEDDFRYPLTMNCDARGSFTEFLRTPERGQLSVNISKPGITKGNHWHHTKHEKFLVVSGRAAVCFRKVGTPNVLTYEVGGDRLEVVDIPPGYIHNITNVGEGDLVTVMWVSEPFDSSRPDTWFEEV